MHLWLTKNGIFRFSQTRENNKTDELLERIHQLENNEAVILKESHELREQNELLEFRIIELEEATTDKVNTHQTHTHNIGHWSNLHC